MKHDVMHASAQVDQSILKNHVEVKETIAREIELAKHPARRFGINDLWNIRKNGKVASVSVRRY